MQNVWASQLNPVLANLLVQGRVVPNISLSSGNNVINHLLGRMQIGWMLIDLDQGVTIYRAAPFNNLTITLNASGTANVSLWCF